MSTTDGAGRATLALFDGGPTADGPTVDALSQRKTVDGLENPCPLARLLPSMLYEDSFAMRLCTGLDEILAPVLVTLDCLDSYFDPSVTPSDFLTWLAQWVGLALDQNWPESRQRVLLRSASELYRWEGTARGIAAYVRLLTDVAPEVVDSGGVAWSSEPGGELPGSSTGELVVRLHVRPGSGTLNVGQVETVVATAKPANIPHRVEVVPGGPSRPGGPTERDTSSEPGESGADITNEELRSDEGAHDEVTNEDLGAAAEHGDQVGSENYGGAAEVDEIRDRGADSLDRPREEGLE